MSVAVGLCVCECGNVCGVCARECGSGVHICGGCACACECSRGGHMHVSEAVHGVGVWNGWRCGGGHTWVGVAMCVGRVSVAMGTCTECGSVGYMCECGSAWGAHVGECGSVWGWGCCGVGVSVALVRNEASRK